MDEIQKGASPVLLETSVPAMAILLAAYALRDGIV
jgi:hypothetical protein